MDDPKARYRKGQHKDEVPPKGEEDFTGWRRVSRDGRWPFGVTDDGKPIAPYGYNEAGYPRVHDPSKRIVNKSGRHSKASTGINAIPDPKRNPALRESLLDKLEKINCDPILGIAEIAMDTENSPETRLRAYSELAGYVYPKKRSVEHTGDGQKKEVYVINVPIASSNSTEEWLNNVKRFNGQQDQPKVIEHNSDENESSEK